MESDTKIIMVLAKKLFDKCPARYKKAVDEGRMLIIAPFNYKETMVTKDNAQKRNEYLLNRSQEVVIGCATPNGMLDGLLKRQNKPCKILVGRK